MPNSYFRFKEFTIQQDACAMKVCTDSCLFGAWTANYFQKYKHDTKSVLDIGSGTGLLSLMLRQKLPSAITDAVEIEPACFEQSRYNIDRSLWRNSIQVYNEDIKSISLQKEYDLIISNPPFYESNLASPSSEKNIAHHNAGLTLQSLMRTVKDNLSHDGIFAVLLPYSRAEEFKNAINREDFYTVKKTLVRQSNKHPIFRAMFLFSRDECETSEDEIIIKENDGLYSEEFISLLKDYYLHL